MKRMVCLICIVVLSCFLFVSCAEIESMKLTGESALGMKIGDVIDDDSIVCEMQPYTATDSDVRWVSSNKEVVTVGKSKEQEPYLGKAFCRIEAVGEGTAEIYAESADGKIKSNSVTVTVNKSGKIETSEKEDGKEKGDETSFTIEDFTDENGVVRFDFKNDDDNKARKELMVNEKVSYSDLMFAIEKYINTRRYKGNPMGAGYGSEIGNGRGNPTLIVDNYKAVLKGTLTTVNQLKVLHECKFEIRVTFNDDFSDFTVDKFSTNMPELFKSDEMQDIS